MNNETVNQEQTAQQERTFTQAELNAIVSDRLNREREKYAGYEELKTKAAKFDEAVEANKSDLQKAQEQAASYKTQLDALQREIDARNAREKIAQETGVPSSLLTADTEDECKEQAVKILAWRGDAPKYPNVKDAGEAVKSSGGKTRDQFANWFNENKSK